MNEVLTFNFEAFSWLTLSAPWFWVCRHKEIHSTRMTNTWLTLRSRHQITTKQFHKQSSAFTSAFWFYSQTTINYIGFQMCGTFYLSKNATKSQPNVSPNLLRAFSVFFVCLFVCSLWMSAICSYCVWSKKKNCITVTEYGPRSTWWSRYWVVLDLPSQSSSKF